MPSSYETHMPATNDELQSYSQDQLTGLSQTWGFILQDDCQPCKAVPENLETPEYVPDTWLKSMSRKMKYQILTSANGNLPPQFAFRFLAELLCPGSYENEAEKKADKTHVTVTKHDRSEMSECERRDLVNMLNVACEDPGRLIEDVQCLMNSEGAQMDQLCLYHLLHMQMDFYEDENSANKISVQGSEVFGWFIHYYVCQIACGMIENDRCSVQSVREFFDRATVQFGLV